MAGGGWLKTSYRGRVCWKRQNTVV